MVITYAYDELNRLKTYTMQEDDDNIQLTVNYDGDKVVSFTGKNNEKNVNILFEYTGGELIIAHRDEGESSVYMDSLIVKNNKLIKCSGLNNLYTYEEDNLKYLEG